MAEVAMHEEHTRAWYTFLVGKKPMGWRVLFANYQATVDAPAAFFYRQILEVFPDAKVLLNLRDPESWYQSYMTLCGGMEHLIPHRATNPRLDMWLRVLESIHDSAMGVSDDHDACPASRLSMLTTVACGKRSRRTGYSSFASKMVGGRFASSSGAKFPMRRSPI